MFPSMHGVFHILFLSRREIIARGWTSTSARLEKINDELARTKTELNKTSQVSIARAR